MHRLTLNTTRPEELYRQARDRMAARLPGWTDEHPGDPAVAVLELAAQVADLQNRTFDRVEERHYAAYLKLLGETPRQAAPAFLLARPLERGGLRPGQRFWVDGVPFEVEDAGKDLGEVERVSLHTGGRWEVWTGPGALPFRGDGLEVTFSRPMPPGERVRLWCALRPEPGRVPPDAQTRPPVRFRALTRRGGEWRETPFRDGTCGLLKSGFWELKAEEEWTAVHLEPTGAPEGTPELEALVPEPVLLAQRRTRSAAADLLPPFRIPEGLEGNYVLRFFRPEAGGGWLEEPGAYGKDGRVAGWTGEPPEVIRMVAQEPDFPCEFTLREIAQERVFLDEDGVLPRSLALMTEEDGVWYDCPVGEPDPASTGRGCRWDPARRELCFGDGRDFRVPRAGRAIASSCVCTGGAAGNGAGGVLRSGETALAALFPAAGGCDRESPKDAFFRAVKEQAELMRAVAPADFETLALRTPGLALKAARCVTRRGEAGVTVKAAPRSGVLTPWRRGRIQEWLERFRPLGVPVEVEELK